MFTTGKIAAVSVINDIVTDHRVLKICRTLAAGGYRVEVTGRELKSSLPVEGWPFRAHRMRMVFKKGPLFYLFFNLRLFLRLLFRKADLLYANDLDTLLPNYLVSRLKGVPLVYDSHELFCEVPELLKTPLKRRIWLALEGWIVPRLKHCITVNSSIAGIFEKKYGVHFHVVRNIPDPPVLRHTGRAELGLPLNEKIILMQGAGINIDRGAEELVLAMLYLENVLLLIIGSGDVWEKLGRLVKENKLEGKVKLISRMPKEQLAKYTANADLGISIDKNTNPNYYYSLPNKLFDYIQAGVPVLVSRLPEIENLVSHYRLGGFIDHHEPAHIAQRIKELLNSPDMAAYRQNAWRAAQELSWEKEQQKLASVIRLAGARHER